LSASRKPVEEGSPKVPGYIVTFSDMVTLLLTFFVLLLSLADVQDPELFNKGRDSFVQSIRQQGLGILFGSMGNPRFGRSKTKYYTEPPDSSYDGRTIDAREEDTRRLFKKASRTMAVLPSQIVASKTNFSVTDIHFAGQDWKLSDEAIDSLAELCQGLTEGGVGKLYVVGLCRDPVPQATQWIISARRARAVASYIDASLLAESRPYAGGSPNAKRLRSGAPGAGCSVHWWGAGSGGQWTDPQSPMYKDSQILIAVLRADTADAP